MKHIHYYIYALLLAASFTACSNDDFSDKVTVSDEVNGPVTFMATAQTVTPTRADAPEGYESWTAEIAPSNMGVFGFYNLNATNFATQNGDTPTDQFFKNTHVKYNDDDLMAVPNTGWTEEHKWRYESPKYWPDYTWCDNFDFFAYMPYDAGATITNPTENNYTVSVPFAFEDNGFILTEKTKLPLLCKIPNHQIVTGNLIKYDMDQTLTAYQLQFSLIDKMDKIRELVVKEVKISGALAKSGTVSRTYTWADGAWASGNITWGSLTKTASTYTKEVEKDQYTLQEYNEKWGTSLDEGAFNALPSSKKNKELLLTKEEFRSWGNPFYVIPTDFTPTITVTYDVLTEINKVLTRYEVESPIDFDSSSWKAEDPKDTMTGKINKINILINPAFLYTLADDDMRNALTIE